jgi:hypothetical protein
LAHYIIRRAERIQQGIRLKPLQVPHDDPPESQPVTAAQDTPTVGDAAGQSDAASDSGLGPICEVDTTVMPEKSADSPADANLTDKLGDLTLCAEEKTDETKLESTEVLPQPDEGKLSEDHKEVEDAPLTQGLEDEVVTVEERAKKRIHNRKFREYCAQELSKDLGKKTFFAPFSIVPSPCRARCNTPANFNYLLSGTFSWKDPPADLPLAHTNVVEGGSVFRIRIRWPSWIRIQEAYKGKSS